MQCTAKLKHAGDHWKHNEPAPQGAGSLFGLRLFGLMAGWNQICRTRPRVTRRSNRVSITAPMTATMMV